MPAPERLWIRPVQQWRIPVFMDSGVRRGSDVARALSLGARAVFVGRPVLYGLATSGQAGAETVLRNLARELELCMTLLGARCTGELAGAVDPSQPQGQSDSPI